MILYKDNIMAMGRFEKVIGRIGIQQLAWTIVVLGIFTVGCAGPAKTSQDDLNLSAETFDDSDFDMLDEEFSEQEIRVADPLEPVNRLMFNFNDLLYFRVLKPVTDVYTFVIPSPARDGIRNFSSNLATPVRFVSCHLQGKTERADIELNRFLINSTVGILGLGDPAKDKHGIEPPKREDLGQALAAHGMGNGFYIVLPLFGPSTVRDSLGTVGGFFLDPVYYVDPREAAMGIGAVRFTNENSYHPGEYEAIKEDSIDPYIAIRDIYLQYRRKQVEE